MHETERVRDAKPFGVRVKVAATCPQLAELRGILLFPETRAAKAAVAFDVLSAVLELFHRGLENLDRQIHLGDLRRDVFHPSCNARLLSGHIWPSRAAGTPVASGTA